MDMDHVMRIVDVIDDGVTHLEIMDLKTHNAINTMAALRAKADSIERKLRQCEAKQALQSKSNYRGRQPGTLSKKWREVLCRVLRKKFYLQDIRRAARDEGIIVRNMSIGDRMRYCKEHNYIIGDNVKGFYVTRHAIHRFKLIYKSEGILCHPPYHPPN